MMPLLNNGEIVDLGSGWGTLVFLLAKHYPHCRITGYEISPIPFLISKMISLCFPFPNVIFKRKDFFEASLKDASLVVCYLYPGAMQKLKEKFERELPNNAYVISHTFAVPGWTPLRIEYVDDLYKTPIYLYRLRANS